MTEAEIAAAGEDVPLLEGLRTARAIRRLSSAPVPPGLIRKVCEAGTFAPSGGNRQPWIFIAVTEPERRAWVAERYRRGFHAYIAPALEAAKQPGYPEARRRNIVWTDQDESRVTFVHDKLREALLARLDDGAQRALHRAAARRIEEAHPDRAFELAYHFSAGGEDHRALPDIQASIAELRYYRETIFK